jgi:hypothetical protein
MDPKTHLLLSQGRLFLSQLNIIPMNDQGTIHLLKNNGSNLNRAIQHLDKCPVRETVKIGVVYVGLNQKHQREIIKNSKPGSDEFEQFVGTLGWPVDLSTHKGFTGGLDTNPEKLSCGRYAPYFCTTMLEAIFHVVTWMPTKVGSFHPTLLLCTLPVLLWCTGLRPSLLVVFPCS